MKWYSNKNWDEQTHGEFYKNYREASPELQAKALIKQADLLSRHLDNSTLKAAESLLILWIKDHFNKEDASEVYSLMATICQRIGDHHRAQEFELKAKA